MRDIWITYKTHYKPDPDPRESGTATYSGVGVWDDELSALRYANSRSLTVVQIFPGETLEEAIDTRGD